MSQNNQTARPGPYTDTSITRRNVTGQSVPTPTPTPSGPTTTGPHTMYEGSGTDHTPGDQDLASTAGSPNHWKVGRNPYANGGNAGQTQFSPASEQ
jgi:hypothetical protein